MNKPLPSDSFEAFEDEISSLNFGLQEDISIKNSEVEYYQFLSQICGEYNLESALQQDPIFCLVYTSFTTIGQAIDKGGHAIWQKGGATWKSIGNTLSAYAIITTR